MSYTVLIGLMAVIVYTLRISGLLSARVEIPDTWQRALGFAPVAVLGALAATSLASQGSDDPLRIAAAAGAGLIMLKAGRMWVCIFGGLGLYWVLRLVIG
jgi:branched-subunit amino acid transport protein